MRLIIRCIFILVAVVVAVPTHGQQAAGIGVALAEKDGRIRIHAILPESPASANHSIRAGDEILAVAQGSGEPKIVESRALMDVVGLIRGPKGSTVRLLIVPAGSNDDDAIEVSFARGDLPELARWGDGVLLEPGTKAPNIALRSLSDERDENLADFTGRVVVLDFWSSGCGPCQKTVGELQEVVQRHPEWRDRVAFITASVDESPEIARKHVEGKEWSRTHQVWVDDYAIHVFHVGALPTTYILDEGQEVVATNPKERLEQVIGDLLRSGETSQ